MYRSILSLASALDGVCGERHVPADLLPGKARYALYRKLGGSQGWSGRVRKISPPPEFDPWTVQPVASRYTDWAILAHNLYMDLLHRNNTVVFYGDLVITSFFH